MSKKMDETIRFSVSLPKGLLKEMDRRSVNKGYSSRSEFVRDLVREKIVEDEWGKSSKSVIGVLTIVYNHHQRSTATKLMDLQHHTYVNVLCSTHVHLDHEHCLEAIIIKGKGNEIESLATQIGGIRGVKLANLSRASSLEL